LGLIVPLTGMADSVYLSTNLTTKQLEFIQLLDEYEVYIFNIGEIEALLDKHFDNLNEILENLVDKKMLARIEKGKFCRANFKDESAIAYWTALNLHGLTEQFSNTIFIQSTHKKNDKKIFGTSYKFIQIAPSKYCGITHNGYGSLKYPITDIEKTLVDCFDMPQYSGGYAELLRAFFNATISSSKLIEYCKAIKNIAVTKRLGFLAELSGKKNMVTFIRFAKQKVNKRYSLFDPGGEDSGEYNLQWKLRLNISEREILQTLNKLY
jgi:predicted transcriptional regulator of viral defense system